MKFSHNILHTYSFILGTIKHNWKIRRFWVADPLKRCLVMRNRSEVLRQAGGVFSGAGDVKMHAGVVMRRRSEGLFTRCDASRD